MAFALWPRPCSAGCGVRKQPGCTSNLTRCSRQYVRGGEKLAVPPFLRRADFAGLGENVIAAVKMVYVEFLPLLDARDDYRRVLLVLPWAALVAIYLLLGIPVHVFLTVFGAGHGRAFSDPDPPICLNFS